MKTPVVLLTFNRPDLTRRALDAIRTARPPALFVSSDGPRSARPAEARLVESVRALVAERVDWPCEVVCDYAEANEGCGRRVSTALTRAFDLFDEAIVLEDDCLPHPQFFRFCEHLLAHHRHDERVVHIGGSNLWAGQHRASSSYVFSRYPHVWGWATWRRAWSRYDFSISSWEARRRGGGEALAALFGDLEQGAYWSRIFDEVQRDPAAVDTWDYQWLYACLWSGGLAVYPSVNLVSNLGFRPDATHTTTWREQLAAVPARELPWPLVHPAEVVHDVEADRAVFARCFRPPRPGLRQWLLGHVTRLERRTQGPPGRPAEAALQAPGVDRSEPFALPGQLLRRIAGPIARRLEAAVSRSMAAQRRRLEDLLVLQGRALALQNAERAPLRTLQDAEFKVFSRFGEDGIVQHLLREARITPEEQTFVEFGASSYEESNTRFLLLNDNWRGLILDASEEHIAAVRREELYWRHDLTAVQAWVDRDNVNRLIDAAGFRGKIGLLSIHLDGNDYWVWERVDVVEPILVIVEWNSVFGAEHAVTVPYDPAFRRETAPHSCLHRGASIRALEQLGRRKGYALVGSNSAGKSLFFVREDRLGRLTPLSAATAYVESRCRESRDVNGRLSFLAGARRREEVYDLPLVIPETGDCTTLRSLLKDHEGLT